MAGAGILAVILLAGCPGPAPPPKEDLASASQKTAESAGMFNFALEAWIELRSPAGEVTRSTSRSEGSARNNEGYRMLISSDPGGGETPIVLEEIPGAVRQPGSPYWFSGASGSMDPFGPLASALPPLGSPSTVTRRYESLVNASARSNPFELIGTGEVRGHSTDCYRFGITTAPISIPTPTGSPFKTPSPSVVTPTAAPAPSPKAIEEAAALLLAKASRVLPSTPPGGLGKIRTSSYACVDQIDGRLRRIQSDVEASLHGAAVNARATMDLWGHDPSGTFNEPIDTSLIGPLEQEQIRSSPFRILGPLRLPEGLQFVSLDPAADWAPCAAKKLVFTGRGREGFFDVLQTASDCAAEVTSKAPAPLVTETASGITVRYGEIADGFLAAITVDGTYAQVRTKNGISKDEAISIAASLRPITVPIPSSRSLPLPQDGPETR
ncbi:MAG: hypothetical protein DCC49_01765 [Acidobacteria bacterium]|nr:MAG: hypothetical protein DCC49_01765 [Acidobacteriota bacterium]